MKLTTFACSLLAFAFTSSAILPTEKLLSPAPQINFGPAMPPPSDKPSSPPSSSVTLSDVIGNDRSINIFAGFTRDFASLSARFEDSLRNTTILAPLNSAIMALPRKPWEDPKEYESFGESVYEGEKGEERAHRNMRRFVEAHIVDQSPWQEGEKVNTVDGGSIWWEEKDGKRIIQPGGIEVASVASKVHNGEVWILKGVRNYQ